VFAPGVSIQSAVNLGDDATAIKTGTSMAAPFVGTIHIVSLLHSSAATSQSTSLAEMEQAANPDPACVGESSHLLRHRVLR
jgi:hypothetical protein